MTGSTLKQFILTPALLSATVFSVLTLPLALLGSKPVTIQIQEEPVFHGQLKDVATPYLGLATAISVGAGIASVAVMGWQQSSRKSQEVEEQLSGLAKNLKEKEELLENLKLSESHLEASRLTDFLDEHVPHEPTSKAPVTPQEVQSLVEPLVITAPSVEVQPVTPSDMTAQAAAAKFASAQAFLGYTQSKSAVNSSSQTKAVVKSSPEETSLMKSELDTLNGQLQQIKAQINSLQTALSGTASEEKSDESATTHSAPLHVVKSFSVNDRVS